jgi:hypothetical protein
VPNNNRQQISMSIYPKEIKNKIDKKMFEKVTLHIGATKIAPSQ